jgi:hypothetical protein
MSYKVKGNRSTNAHISYFAMIEEAKEEDRAASRCRFRWSFILLVGGTLEPVIPTPEEFQSRREFYERVAKLLMRKPQSGGPFPSAEEMIREDRNR